MKHKTNKKTGPARAMTKQGGPKGGFPVYAEIKRHVLGLVVGSALFWFLIPYGLYRLSVYSNRFVQIDIPDSVFVRSTSLLLLGIGVLLVFWSYMYLSVVGKGGAVDAFGVAVSPRTRHLVVRGPYRYSRNPMVLGIFCCYLAVAVLLGSIITVAVVILWFCVMILMFKFSEEKRLLRDFGRQYLRYKQRVPMIVPWPTRRRIKKR